MARLRPDLAEQWHPTKNGNLKPENFSIGSHQSVWWLLKYEDKTYGIFNFEWKASIASRKLDGSDCPYFHGISVYQGYNDLASRNKKVANLWYYKKNKDLKPTDVSVHSGKEVYWKCSICGKIFKKRVNDMTRYNQTHCPHCKQLIPKL